MAKLKDSGERRGFETGAQRDISEGKGRCDLLPLDDISIIMNAEFNNLDGESILFSIHRFMVTKEIINLVKAIHLFSNMTETCLETIILKVSIHYEDGAGKYDERNWQKGLPLHCFIDSGVRHYLKWLRGDQDEPHDRAFIWNMIGAIWTMRNRPDLDDIEMPG